MVVRNSNAAPVLSFVGNQVINETQTLTLQLAATDPDGDRLTYTATNLPSGAILDPVTGVLTWTPNLFSAGTYSNIEWVASDGNRASSQKLAIVVNNTNQKPVLTSLPAQSGRENTLLQFSLVGTDIDGDKLTYSSINPLPAGMSLNAQTGQVRWTPSFESSGNYVLQFAATDTTGASSSFDVAIKVDNVNRNPVLSVSNHAVALGNSFDFTLAASDPDSNTTLTYTATNLPDGAVLDSTTGHFTWTPTPGQVGDFTVNFATSDGLANTTLSTLLRFAITPPNPAITLNLTPSFATLPDQAVQLQATASSLADITNITLSVDGKPIALDSTGRGQFVPDNPGRYNVSATAHDADGRVGYASSAIKVRDAFDTAAPVVAFAPGLDGTKVQNTFDLIGTVSDRNLDDWTLEIATTGSDKWVTLASGYSTLDKSVLNVVNPDSWANGFYTLRLSATDMSDRTERTSAVVEVSTSNKLGQYYQTQTDLSVAIGGLMG